MSEPIVQWRKGFDSSVIVKRLELLRKHARGAFVTLRNRAGSEVSFAIPDYEPTVAVLTTALQFSGQYAAYADELLRQALPDAAKTGTITEKSLIQAILAAVKGLTRPEMVEHLFVGSLSWNPKRFPSGAVGNRDSIRFMRRLPDSINAARQAVLPKARRWVPDIEPADYSFVVVRARAADARAAHRAAKIEFDLLRAMWLLADHPGWSHSWGKPHKPLAPIRWGALSTVHLADGTLAEEIFWVDESFRRTVDIHTDSLSVVERRGEKGLLREFARIEAECGPDERRRLENWLCAYVRALSEPDHSTCFLALWTVFEKVTGGLAPRGGYDRNIERAQACFVGASSAWVRQVLKHLQFVRNELTHEPLAFAANGGDIDSRLWAVQLQHILHDLLRFFASTIRLFGSVSAVYEALDLPRDVAELKARRRVLDGALKIRARA